jgi:hypothetical protein
MTISNHISTAIIAISLCCAAAWAQAPLPVLEALPTTEALGPGWRREISVMFDPASKPPELFAASSRLPERFKQERREAVQNPTNLISGWAHSHFSLQSTNTAHHFDVQIERYRNREHLAADFNQLLAFDSAEYQKVPVDRIGDAAVFYSKTNNGTTLWFRRADFKVWIAAMGTATNWLQNEHLQRLARMLDQRIVRATPQGVKTTRSGKGEGQP